MWDSLRAGAPHPVGQRRPRGEEVTFFAKCGIRGYKTEDLHCPVTGCRCTRLLRSSASPWTTRGSASSRERSGTGGTIMAGSGSPRAQAQSLARRADTLNLRLRRRFRVTQRVATSLDGGGSFWVKPWGRGGARSADWPGRSPRRTCKKHHCSVGRGTR